LLSQNQLKEVRLEVKNNKVSKPKALAVIKRIKEVDPDQRLFYFGVSAIEQNPKTWSDAKLREFIWESAIETARVHDEGNLKRLFDFAFKSLNIKTRNTLNECEIEQFGFCVTSGSSKKRSTFWKMLTYISQGIVPVGLSAKLIHKPNAVSPFVKSNQIYKATLVIANAAKQMIAEGSNIDLHYKADYVVGQESNAKLNPASISTNQALALEDHVRWHYKSLLEWSRQS
jgi:hypothetical protein